MDNIKTMIAEIRMLIVDEVADRLDERLAESTNFHPTDSQSNEMAKIIAKEVKDNTLNQVEACIETELDLSVDVIWDKILEKWQIEDDMDYSDYSVFTERNLEPSPEQQYIEKEIKSCPGCCDKPVEKINEKEGIQSHIVDMEW